MSVTSRVAYPLRLARSLVLLLSSVVLAGACDDNTSGAEDLAATAQPTGGAGGGGGAGGVSGGGGAAPLLEPPSYCAPCMQAECAPALAACNADEPCRALFSCQQACGTDLTCYVACDGTFPLGARHAEQLRDCLDRKPCSGCIRWSHGLSSSDCDKCRDTACWSEYGDAQASRDYWQFIDCWDACKMGISCYSPCKQQYAKGYSFLDRWTTCLQKNCKGC